MQSVLIPNNFPCIIVRYWIYTSLKLVKFVVHAKLISRGYFICVRVNSRIFFLNIAVFPDKRQ